MLETIVFGIISLALIAAIFFGWYYYRQARDKERMALIQKGEKLEDIINAEKKNRLKFYFPWLKLGVIVMGLGLAFFLIGLIFLLDGRRSEFLDFLRPSIIGLCIGLAMLANHFLSKKK